MPEEFSITEIINRIKDRKNLSRKDIAERLGYNENYISNAIKTGGNPKFYDKLKLTFPDIFEELENDKLASILKDDGIVYAKRRITLEDLALSTFKQQAILQVLLAGFVDHLVSVTGSPYKKVLAEIESAVDKNLAEIQCQFPLVSSMP